MKVWITKYALSSGPKEIEVEDCGTGMVAEKCESFPRYFHGEGRDWHRTKESALARCEVVRQRKLASLAKESKRIAALNFEGML